MMNISEMVQDAHSFNKIVIGTYTHPTQQYHFEKTLSNLAKYSMTRSVVQSVCDSWASCHHMFVTKWTTTAPKYDI